MIVGGNNMRKEHVEPFVEFAALRRGVPSLRTWTEHKRMSIDWHDGGIRDYERFAAVLDREAMFAALNELWRRHKAWRLRASLFGGNVGGHMARVPIEIGIEAAGVVRDY